MYPKHHILLGFIFSVFVFILFPKIGILGVSIIFLSSFLIDVDHYIGYAIRKRDWNVMNAIKWNFEVSKKANLMKRKERNKFYVFLFFLHGFEVLFVLALLAIFVSPLFLFILTGFTFHLTLDVVHQRFYWDRMDKLSLIYDYFKYKKLKKIDL